MIIEWFMSVNQPAGGVSIPFNPRDPESARGAVLIADGLLKEKHELDPNRQWSVLAYRPLHVMPAMSGGWTTRPTDPDRWEFPEETI